jgi:hypothetical protein
MKPIQDLKVCVVDHGLFLPVAKRISRDVAKVYFWSPWDIAFPTVKTGLIGSGFPDIERTDSVWSVKDECDLFVFPDIGMADMQNELIGQGKPVWGARYADSYETDRQKFMHAVMEMGLDTPTYHICDGLTELRDYIADKSDKWIKISRWRGDVETMHWRDWSHDEITLDLWAFKLGPAKELIQFLVFDPIETDVEDGYDGYCIDGQFPSVCLHGMEAKDKAYLCTVEEYAKLPSQLLDVNKAFGPLIAADGYRSFMSTEVRIAGDNAYFIDPTLRAGSPPSQLMTEIFGNFTDIIWQGAQGNCIDPEPTAQFGVQAIICVKGDKTMWRAFESPPEIEQFVKCGNCAMIDGKLCFPPDESGDEMVGWLVATGNTIQAAIDELKARTEQLPDGVECKFHALADLLKEVETAEESGIKFTDQSVPEPASVIEDSK